jgi:hypothetical protein
MTSINYYKEQQHKEASMDSNKVNDGNLKNEIPSTRTNKSRKTRNGTTNDKNNNKINKNYEPKKNSNIEFLCTNLRDLTTRNNNNNTAEYQKDESTNNHIEELTSFALV